MSGRPGVTGTPSVHGMQSTSANGMSSDTVLFDATWQQDGRAHDEQLVARIAPFDEDLPVFASYDLNRQFEAMRIAGEQTTVPVPRVFWMEPDPGPIGSQFFIMGRIDGEVPPDVMPYTFGDNWVYDGTPEQRHALQQRVVDVLAQFHQIEDPDRPGSRSSSTTTPATPTCAAT